MIAHIKDNTYWDNYYKNNQHVAEISIPSNFAIFCMNKLNTIFNKKINLLEIGCGNGRDSEFFSINHKVTACDLSQVSISELNNRPNTQVKYLCADFTNLHTNITYDVIYSRFTLHSVDLEGEIRTIKKAHEILNKGGVFMIETRSNYDEICGRGEKVSDCEWIYDGHYRRFNILEDFLTRIKENGFEPLYVLQSNDLAIFGDRNPVVIRTIFKKKTE